jgi:hypothetical protein
MYETDGFEEISENTGFKKGANELSVWLIEDAGKVEFIGLFCAARRELQKNKNK